jgi:endonuclease G
MRPKRDDIVLDHGVYVLSYNRKMRVANWVAWHLGADDLGEVERADAFRLDGELPVGVYRVKPDDYTGSGFDRGQICPSADRTSTDAVNEITFLMSNMHPQDPALNRGPWKALEVHERELVKRDHQELYVVAGGIFSNTPSTMGPGIAVPAAEYKIIVVLEEGQGVDDVTAETPVVAVIMPNEPTVKQKPWTAYVVSVDEVEQTSGYDFLATLPDEVDDVIEARVAAPPP